jgi:predicted enzyme related to lactoylglutathione lyase
MRWTELSCLDANWLFHWLRLAAGASTAPGAPAASAKTGFQAVSITIVSVRVPDIHRTSQFYQEFFGMPLRQQSATALFSVSEIPFLALSKPGGTIATVDHFDFGIANFNANDVRAKLREWRLNIGFHFKGIVQVL